MGNEIARSRILEALRAADSPVSGETLGEALGSSRVTVWKHVRALREAGYDIEALPTGYRLHQSPDTPHPWEFGCFADRVRHYPSVASTMETAREAARSGAPHMTAVVAETQTNGRGRLRRPWVSDEGGLWFTLVLRPEMPPALSFRAAFLAAVSMARTLRELFDLPARVKWPNDVLIHGRKVCGILAEMETEADLVSFVCIGIGVNVNNTPPEIDPPACSIRELTGREASRVRLLSGFLDRFSDRWETILENSLIAEWKSLSATLGRRVRIATLKSTTEGLALDVDDSGALLVQKDDGETERVIYGDCFSLPEPE